MSDDVVFVLVVKDGELDRAHGALRQMLDTYGHESVANGWACIGPDAEMVLDVFREPLLGGGRHVAVVRDSWGEDKEWVIEHSLVCRRTGEMADCPYIALVNEANNERELTVGRLVLSRHPETGALIWEDET